MPFYISSSVKKSQKEKALKCCIYAVQQLRITETKNNKAKDETDNLHLCFLLWILPKLIFIG